MRRSLLHGQRDYESYDGTMSITPCPVSCRDIGPLAGRTYNKNQADEEVKREFELISRDPAENAPDRYLRERFGGDSIGGDSRREGVPTFQSAERTGHTTRNLVPARRA